MVAIGESQSAIYLTTFADAVQPRTDTFDGIFLHSRFGFGAPLGSNLVSGGGSDTLRIRTDLKVPVFMAETQTDVIQFGYWGAQQPNTDRIRTWEIAGTSHADASLLGNVPASTIGCKSPINTGPQHNVVQAAFTAFDKWVVDGTPPPSPPPFRLATTHPPTLALDAHGNVVGGVRTPAVDVPVSTLSGTAPAGAPTVCQFFGSTVAFTPAQLASLYGTKSHYIAEYTASLDKAIAGGYILSADRASLLAQAERVQFPELNARVQNSKIGFKSSACHSRKCSSGPTSRSGAFHYRGFVTPAHPAHMGWREPTTSCRGRGRSCSDARRRPGARRSPVRASRDSRAWLQR